MKSKKIISVLAATALTFGSNLSACLPSGIAFAESDSKTGYEYSVEHDNQLCFYKRPENGILTAGCVPQTKEFRDQITEISINDSNVEVIGESVFKDYSNVNYISFGWIYDANSPAILKTIGKSAFENCTSLESLKIPFHISEIGDDAFKGCTSLKEVTIINRECKISDTAFSGCPDVTINGYKGSSAEEFAKKNSVPFKVIGSDQQVFYYTGYNEITISGGETFDGSSLPYSQEMLGSIQSIIVEEGCKSVNNYHSCFLTNNPSVSLPKSIEKFMDNADLNWSSYEFGENINYIGENAFNVFNGEYTILNKDCEIKDNAFNHSGLKLKGYAGSTAEKYAKKYNIPFTAISDSDIECEISSKNTLTFMGTGKLKANIVPQTGERFEHVIICGEISEISAGAFKNFNSLNKVTINNYCELTIAGNAFSDCTSLQDIIFPKAIANINSNAFSGCSSLSKITVINKECEINDDAFTDCPLEKIIGYEGSTAEKFAKEKNIPFEVITMQGSLEREQKYYDDSPYILKGTGALDKYNTEYSEPNISYIRSAVTFEDGITEAGYFLLYGCDTNSVTLPDTLKAIRTYAFGYCSEIYKITIPASVEVIEEHAFANCFELSKITILNPNCEIQDNAFANCTELNSFTSCIYGRKGSTAEKYAKEHNIDFSVIESEPGDLTYDGVIDARDASVILTAYAKLSVNSITSDDIDIDAYDINKDNITDARDASVILGYYAKSSSGFDLTLNDYMKLYGNTSEDTK